MSNKTVLIKSALFAKEHRARSWFYATSSWALLVLAILGGLRASNLWIQVLLSLCIAAMISRTFVIYHDYVHGAILKNSTVARILFFSYGIFCLSPLNVWKRTHDYHHRYNGRISKPNIGTFTIFSRQRFEASTKQQQFHYLLKRHPAVIILGYFTTFLYGMCIQPALADIRKHYDSLLSILFHAVYVGLIFNQFGGTTLICTVLLPNCIAYAVGAYLFYAQHNFPNVQYTCDNEWTYEASALESSSFIKMGRLMSEITGNIGYHHIHHINPKIPFYRLPEAMREIPELQNPKTTTLGLRDVLKCLSLKVWDEQKNRMTPI